MALPCILDVNTPSSVSLHLYFFTSFCQSRDPLVSCFPSCRPPPLLRPVFSTLTFSVYSRLPCHLLLIPLSPSVYFCSRLDLYAVTLMGLSRTLFPSPSFLLPQLRALGMRTA